MIQPSLPVLTALGQKTRWRIFEALLPAGETGMLQGEIARKLGVEKNLLSVHLKVLREAGLVTGERSGREVTYRVVPEAAKQAAEAMLDTIKGATNSK